MRVEMRETELVKFGELKPGDTFLGEFDELRMKTHEVNYRTGENMNFVDIATGQYGRLEDCDEVWKVRAKAVIL